MRDWVKKLDKFLEFNDESVLKGKGSVSMNSAKTFAETEFEKYKKTRDRAFQSDFDKLLSDCRELEEGDADDKPE